MPRLSAAEYFQQATDKFTRAARAKGRYLIDGDLESECKIKPPNEQAIELHSLNAIDIYLRKERKKLEIEFKKIVSNAPLTKDLLDHFYDAALMSREIAVSLRKFSYWNTEREDQERFLKSVLDLSQQLSSYMHQYSKHPQKYLKQCLKQLKELSAKNQENKTEESYDAYQKFCSFFSLLKIHPTYTFSQTRANKAAEVEDSAWQVAHGLRSIASDSRQYGIKTRPLDIIIEQIHKYCQKLLNIEEIAAVEKFKKSINSQGC